MDEAAGLAPAALARMLALGLSGTQPFRDLIDALPAAIYTTDAQGKLTHFNPACIAFSGRTPMLGSDHWCVTWKLYHPDGTPMPHYQCPMAATLRERRPIRGQEAIAERPDGTRIWFQPYPTPLFDESGQLIGGINMLVDISERKQAERQTAQLLEREQLARVEAEALNELSKSLSGNLDLHCLVQQATDAATRLTGAEFGAFFYNVTDGAGQSYVLYTLSGAPREAFEKFGLPRNTPLFGPTFRGEGIVRLDDVLADPRYGTMEPHHGMPKGHLPVRSYLAIPVISRTGEVHGGLFFGHSSVGVFRADTERLVNSIASQAAIAIDNAQLVRSLQQREDALRRSEACLTGQKEAFQMAMNGQSLAESLQALVNTAVAQNQGEARAAFYVVGDDGGLHHVTGMTEAYARDVDGFRISPETVACGLTMHLREPVIAPDVDEDPAWEQWRWLARKHDYRACWSFPVRTSGGPIVGTLAMYFAQPRQPSAADMDLAATLAHAAAVIISRDTQATERAQAEEALSAELQASAILHDISAEFIREGSEQEMYERILDAAVALMQSDFASMQMLHPDRGAGGELRLLGHRGFSDAAVRLWEWMPAGSGTTCGGALSAGTRQIASDVEQSGLDPDSEHLAMFRALGIRATQTTPLASRDGKLLGMISTHWKVPHVPPQRDLRLFDILARQAADFIERTQGAMAMRDADRRKDEFLATLAHELRNPLAPIRYAAVLARRSESTIAQRQEAVGVIERQAAHMARLLDDLLDISRITRGSLELRRSRVELASVVAAAVEAARPLLDDRHHTLTVRLPDEPVRFEADAVRVTQVLSNLLTNAAKYTDPQGQIELSAREQDGEIVLAVRDNGIGISGEMLSKVFLIFSQAKPALERADGGLGIGLALVRGLVQLHGGSVEAFSAGPGRGSEFVVRLPRGAEARADGAAMQEHSPTSASQQLRVLLADDNHDGADICAALLGAMGHEVQTAYCGRTALEAAGSMRPHVALLDIGMPELNGYEVAKRIRAEAWGQRMVLVAVTGWGQQSDKDRALAAGFDHHITKPMDPERLESVFDSVRKDSLASGA